MCVLSLFTYGGRDKNKNNDKHISRVLCSNIETDEGENEVNNIIIDYNIYFYINSKCEN